jgi:hypothetical protein
VKIAFLGDCHTAWNRLIDGIDQCVSHYGIESAVQVGDFGFFPNKMLMLVSGWPGRFPVPLHVIDGNHEDHAWLEMQKKSQASEHWFTNKNIVVHDRGSVASLGGTLVGFCGGALHADRRQHGSIDKGTTNWLTNRQADRAAEAFNKAKVDIVVTHSCPHSIGIGMHGSDRLAHDVEMHVTSKGFDAGSLADCGEPALSRLWRKLKYRPRHWIFGHFHAHHCIDIQGTNFRCIGSIDGSDNRALPVGYILETGSNVWTEVPIDLRI